MNTRRVLAHGVAWAAGAIALETLGLPLGQISLPDLLWFQAGILPRYGLAGLLLAATLPLLERRWALQWAGLVLLALSLLVCGLQWVGRATFGAPLPPEFPGSASYLYILWSSLLYGGLFMAAHHLATQEERTRRLLAQAAIARENSEAMLSAAQIRALQGQLDPAFLLQVMVAVQQRYPVGADVNRLLDALVDFLRVAMPGVRSGTFPAGAEAALASAYALVLHELEAGDAPRDPTPRFTPMEACHES